MPRSLYKQGVKAPPESRKFRVFTQPGPIAVITLAGTKADTSPFFQIPQGLHLCVDQRLGVATSPIHPVVQRVCQYPVPLVAPISHSYRIPVAVI